MRRQYPFAEDVQNYVDRSLVLTHAFVPVIEVQLFCFRSIRLHVLLGPLPLRARILATAATKRFRRELRLEENECFCAVCTAPRLAHSLHLSLGRVKALLSFCFPASQLVFL